MLQIIDYKLLLKIPIRMRIYKALVVCNVCCEYNIIYCFTMNYTPSEKYIQIPIHNLNSGLQYQNNTQVAGILCPTYK